MLRAFGRLNATTFSKPRNLSLASKSKSEFNQLNTFPSKLKVYILSFFNSFDFVATITNVLITTKGGNSPIFLQNDFIVLS